VGEGTILLKERVGGQESPARVEGGQTMIRCLRGAMRESSHTPGMGGKRDRRGGPYEKETR